MSLTIPSFSSPSRTQPYANSQSINQSSQRSGSLPPKLKTLVTRIKEDQGSLKSLKESLCFLILDPGLRRQRKDTIGSTVERIETLKIHLAKGILGLPTSEHSAKQKHLIERIKGLQVELDTTEGSKQQSVQAVLNILLKRLAKRALAN